ncbi:MAG TPA: carboxylating nicotinate-nucleotide diphosphorylase, partial [Spirochaetia bacterium]|nr:carboxylating nicotinate-nucleotide diphosphorylase [Spirochaetia bacterium]
AGAEVFAAVFAAVDEKTSVDFHRNDGESLSPGDQVATVEGKATAVLSAERVALNFLSFLSGIATSTREYVEEAARGGSARILDTRKTLPGYRTLSKYAVSVGGGTNHRMGLYDMIMLKDNHIDRAGSITRAVGAVRERWGERYRIEVECRTLADVSESLALEVDVIMLDNMSIEETRRAVALCDGRTELEASGNMNLSRIREVSATGVDFISIGMLTHSVAGLDFSLTLAAREKY